MPIDTSIQFNGHNSYRVTETVFCDPFGVQGMAYVTHSFHAYAGSALGAATRARTRFFKADGSIAGTTDHSFTVAAVFTQVDITVAVPALSVLCQVSFLTSGTWWVVEPKSEEGQTATPYNTNYAGQLSLITPDGAYLGMLTTSQIVVAGSLADPTESLYERLITINNNAITLSATSVAHGSAITLIQAGAITLSGSTGGTIPAACIGVGSVELAKLGTTIISGGYIDTDLIDVDTLIARMVLTNSLVAAILTNDPTDPECWASIGQATIGGVLMNGQALFKKGFSPTVPVCRIMLADDGSFHLVDSNGISRVYMTPTQIRISDAAGVNRFYADANTNFIKDAAGVIRFQADATQSFIKDAAGVNVFHAYAGVTVMRLSGGTDNAIYTTSSGPACTINGVAHALSYT